MNNYILIYVLSLIPGLGHIALHQRKKGYLFVALDVVLFSVFYLAALMFKDTALPVRFAVGLLLLVIPYYIWVYTDLVCNFSDKKPIS